MLSFQTFIKDIPYFIVAPIFIGTWVILGFVAKKMVFLYVEKFSARTKSKIDDILVASISRPFDLLVLISGIAIAYKFLVPINVHQQLTPLVPISLKVLTILAVILFVDQLVRQSIKAYAAHSDVLHMSQGIIGGLSRGIIYSLGSLIILDSLGISITPIIASLGIGSLAVALALQPTLENFFAGFQIILDQPIKPGHFIRLESGEEGYVEKVGWRTTWIRQLPNNMIIIPNSQLVKSRLLNYYYPNKIMGTGVDIGVHYNSDLEKVERVCIEVAKDVLKTIPGGVPEFMPSVRFNKLDGSSINCMVGMQVNEFVDQYLVKHAFIKAIVKRFAQEGIVLPYPITALNTTQEQAQIQPTRN